MQISRLVAFLGSKKGIYSIVSTILLIHFIFVVSSGWNTSIPVDFNRNLKFGFDFYSKGQPTFSSPVIGQGHLFGLAPVFLGIDLDKDSWFGSVFRRGNNKALLAYHDVLDKNEMNAEFYENAREAKNEDRIRKVLRLSIIIEGIISTLTALVVFIWAKQAFGLKSGYVGLLFYSFSPFSSALVHGLHADNLTRLTVLVVFFYFWKFLINPTKKNLILTGLFLGVSMSVKVTTVYYPILIFVVLTFMILKSNTFKEKIKFIFKNNNKYFNTIISYFLIGLIALFVLNGLYVFKGTFTPISKYDYELQSDFFLNLESSFIGKIPLPISSYYMSSLDTGLGETDDTAYLFFLGDA